MKSIKGTQLSGRKTQQKSRQRKRQMATSSAQMEKATEMLIDTDEDTHTDSTQVY